MYSRCNNSKKDFQVYSFRHEKWKSSFLLMKTCFFILISDLLGVFRDVNPLNVWMGDRIQGSKRVRCANYPPLGKDRDFYIGSWPGNLYLFLLSYIGTHLGMTLSCMAASVWMIFLKKLWFHKFFEIIAIMHLQQPRLYWTTYSGM